MVSTSSSPLLRSSSPQLGIPGKRTSPSSTSVRLRLPRIVAAAASFASAEKTGSMCRFHTGLASSCNSLYDVLGIPMGASGEEIKAAYRRLARACHPDVVAVDRRDSSADEFMKIHAAYSTLSDPEKRADYDRNIFRRYRRFGAYSGISDSTAAAMFSGYTGRNWETDQCW
ncbi:hypothetical protein U1Q18_040091 [Sarracenia purpurea var. burkii]